MTALSAIASAPIAAPDAAFARYVRLYYVVIPAGSASPSPAQIVAGTDYGAITIVAAGSVAYSGAGTYDADAAPVAGASPGTAYDQWWVAFDGDVYGDPVVGEVSAADVAIVPAAGIATAAALASASVAAAAIVPADGSASTAPVGASAEAVSAILAAAGATDAATLNATDAYLYSLIWRAAMPNGLTGEQQMMEIYRLLAALSASCPGDVATAVLAAAQIAPIAANVKQVNDVPLAGSGVPGSDPWRPA